MTRYSWKLIILISIAGMFEVYDIYMTGYIAPGLFEGHILNATTQGFFDLNGIAAFIGAFFLGMFIGTIVVSQLADKIGRKRVFVLCLLLYSFATFMVAVQTGADGLNFWRMVAGIGIGVSLTTIDTFASELAPRNQRGRAVAVTQGVGFIAVPVVAFLAWLLVPLHPFGVDGWRVVVAIGASGAIVVYFIQRGLPESPRWLLRKGRIAEAEAVTALFERHAEAELGHALPRPLPMPEVEDVETRGSLAEAFRPPYRGRTWMLIVFNIFQTIGYYGFVNWVPTLLIAKGIYLTKSLEYTFIIALVYPLSSLIGVVIGDRVERKWQVAGSAFAIAVFGILFSMQTSVAGLIVTGIIQTISTTWLSFSLHAYQPELYPTRIRAGAVGFVYSWSRFSAIFTGFLIAFLLKQGGTTDVFMFVAGAMAVVVVTIGIFGPRTSNRALEDISR